MMSSTYKNLFIDWHNTLSTSLFWGHLQDAAHTNHRFYRILQPLPPDIHQTLFTPWMRGQVTSEEVIYAMSEKLNLDYHLIWQEFIRGCQSMQLVSEEIPSLISQIRARGVKVVIATNNTDSFSRWTVPSLKLLEIFDAILNSADVRGLKWDVDAKGQSLFFADFLHGQGIHPGESILIDDNNSEMARERTHRFGIEYRRIEPRTGLVPELRGIIASLHEEA
ncbi:MAG TPA: HAD hydrolase-like protein [Ktedonobacteraceae bacterium]